MSMETSTRKRLTVSIPEYALNDLRKEAEKTGWSLSALAGEYILDAMYHEPNEETKAAIEEAMNRKEYPAKDCFDDVDKMFEALDAEV